MTITAEQLTERKNYIGASDAAGVLGLSRWSSPLKVWSSKTGAIPDEDIGDKLIVRMGNKLEPVITELFEEETGKRVHRVKQTVFHPKYPFIAVNLDGRVVGEDAIFEAKHTAWLGADFEDGKIPAEYAIQCLHALAVTGKARAYIAVLVAGAKEFLWQVVERDEDLINQIIAAEVAFWNGFVVPNVMPTTVTKIDSDTLSALFPKGDERGVVNLGDDAQKLAESVTMYTADAKVLDGVIEEQRNKLKLMLGENGLGKTDLFNITWRNNKAGTRVLRVSRIKK